jgi:hypothetical protein
VLPPLQDRRSWHPVDAQVADGTLGEIDGFEVGLVERFLVHVLANDADPHSVQRLLVREWAP